MSRLGAGRALAWGLVLGMGSLAQAYPDRNAGSIALTVSPLAARLGSTGRFLFVLDASSETAAIVDTLLMSQIETVTLPGPGRDLGLSIDGKSLYVLTNQNDQVVKIDVTDPRSPGDTTTLTIGTSGVAFENLAVGGTSGSDVLYLTSGNQDALYGYNVKNDALVPVGVDDRVNLGYEPAGLSITTDLLRVAVLGQGGKFRAFVTSSLGQAGATLDLGPLTDSADFLGIRVGALATGDFAFLSNNVAPGELFLVSMAAAGNNLSIVDADPDAADTNPIPVGDAPVASLETKVSRPADGASSENPTYLFVADEGDDTLSVIDTADIGGSSPVTRIDTVEGVTGVPTLGMSASSFSEGYLYAANRQGSSISVVTDQPFLTVVSAPEEVTGSADGEVVLRSTQAGSLRVLRYTGGVDTAVSDTAGDTLETANLSANTDTPVSFPTSDFVEGKNTVAFFLDAGAREGRTGIELIRNTNPETPHGFRLAFGDEKIFVSWKRNGEPDMDHYELTFGTTADAEGGVAGLVSPRRVDQPSSGNLRVILEPIPNGTVVYAKVIAVDDSGLESRPTDILSETTEKTVGLLGRTGESGSCAASGGSFLLLAGALLLLSRSRRKRGVGVAMVLLFSAHAQADDAQPSLPPHSSAEFRIGWWIPVDDAVKEFYGESGNEFFSLRFGFLLGDLDLGVEGGILSESEKMRGVTSGRVSGEEMHLTLVPTEFSAQYNFRWDSRAWFVPFLRVGYDLIYFKISEPEDSASGMKQAFAPTAGFRLNFEGAAGNDMEDLLGIRHMYIEGVFTYRVAFGGGMDVSGWVLQPGIGMEF